MLLCVAALGYVEEEACLSSCPVEINLLAEGRIFLKGMNFFLKINPIFFAA